jgi:hypothetical protein
MADFQFSNFGELIHSGHLFSMWGFVGGCLIFDICDIRGGGIMGVITRPFNHIHGSSAWE